MIPTVRAFWTQQLASKQARLAALQTAYDGLLTGGVQSYTLNTGQTQQTVTRVNIAILGTHMKFLETEIVDLLNKLDVDGASSAVVISRPGF